MGQFWCLGFTRLFLALSLHLVFVHVVPYSMETGISPMDAAVILSLFGVANLPGRILVGRLSDYVSRQAIAMACALMVGLSILWLMWIRDLWMFYAFGIALGFLWGGSDTMTTALVGDVFGMRDLGVIMGMMSAGWAMGAAIGPVLAGVLFDRQGNYFAAFAAAVASVLISTLLVAFIKKR